MENTSDRGNQYALHALRERRAEMAGEITQFEGRFRHLREFLVHVDATLRLLAPDADPTKIANKRRYRRVKLFRAGKLNQMILGVLRRGERPMTMMEVVESIVAGLDCRPAAAKGMKNRVQAKLTYLVRHSGLVVKEGDRSV